MLEDDDPALLAAALGDITRARGMTELAKATGLSRESLYKSLSGERIPTTETLFKVIHALGFKLTISTAWVAVRRTQALLIRGGKIILQQFHLRLE